MLFKLPYNDIITSQGETKMAEEEINKQILDCVQTMYESAQIGMTEPFPQLVSLLLFLQQQKGVLSHAITIH